MSLSLKMNQQTRKNDFIVLDCEVYPNYFLAAFKNIESGKIITIEIVGAKNCLSERDAKNLKMIMSQRMTFGFNSNNYDIPIILYALRLKSCKEIHQLSDLIILSGKSAYDIKRDMNLFAPPNLSHFDLIESSPGVKVSLKLYGARMHSKRLQDLPIEPGKILTPDEIEITRKYCINDLDTTIDLYRKIEDRIQLRFDMSEEYQQSLLSKSDAQIAEAVIKSELAKLTGKKRLKAPALPKGIKFRYKAPPFIKFNDWQLQDALHIIENHDFELEKSGSIKLPDVIKNLKIYLGNSIYHLGLGGVHSTEKSQSVIPNENQFLIDKDVASYYPAIILNLRLYPKHLGEQFLEIYEGIVQRRLKAKKEKNKVVNESLKIVINGSFGKFGNKWSVLYSPDLMMTVTLTGQLSLMMLIEKLEDNGISVVSANTDGFVSLMDKDQYDLYESICEKWQKDTNFVLEEKRYSALYSRDVNNYLAVPEDFLDEPKGKGIFVLDDIQKNPAAQICVKAVIEYLVTGKDVKKTILESRDIRDFLTVRTVRGGGQWRGEYLGKVVRWIYSTDGDSIVYKSNGNKVAKSDGARPIMELGKFPKDLDYDRYIAEAFSILKVLGV